MKKFLKKFAWIVLCALILSPSVYITPSISVAPVLTPASSESFNVSQSDDAAVPLAEETKWYIRNNNGKLQKRLWSITRGKWLTDWIDC